MRRIILKCTLTLMLLLGISLSAGLTALAAGEVSVQVKDVSVSPGKTVTTELIMDGTFAAFQGLLAYDTNALTLEKIEATSALSGSMTMFKQDEVTGEFKDGSFVSASANNAEINGAVLTFTFRAGSNANGTYSFSVDQFLVYDEKGAELTVKAVDTPVERPGNHPTDPVETTPGETNPGETNPGETTPGGTNPGETTPGGTNQEETNQDGTTIPTTNTPGADPNDPDPDRSGGGWVIVLIILVLVGAGIALMVVRAKKKDNPIEDQIKDPIEAQAEDREGQIEDKTDAED